MGNNRRENKNDAEERWSAERILQTVFSFHGNDDEEGKQERFAIVEGASRKT
jgi:hypothetical protein